MPSSVRKTQSSWGIDNKVFADVENLILGINIFLNGTSRVKGSDTLHITFSS